MHFCSASAAAAPVIPFRVIGAWLMVAVAVVVAAGRRRREVRGLVPGPRRRVAAARPTSSTTGSRAEAARRLASCSRVESGRLDDADHGATVERVRSRLPTSDDVASVTDPFAVESAALSADGQTALRRRDRSPWTSSRPPSSTTPRSPPTSAAAGGVDVEFTGPLALLAAEEPSSELIGIGVAIIVLLIAFGSIVAMGLPIATALFGLFVGASAVGVLSALHGRAGVLADPVHDGRPRRRHRLRAVHRHPSSPEPARRA